MGSTRRNNITKLAMIRSIETEFTMGDWVWLRLLNRPVASLDSNGRS
jgi:hypothetical protein